MIIILYNYNEAVWLCGNNYGLKKAIANKQLFKIEKGIYSDGKDNFTLIELVMKKYSNAFLVRESALYYIGFTDNDPEIIHIGTARNALRIKDKRIKQHFYSNLEMSTLNIHSWMDSDHILSYKNIIKHTLDNGNEIRIFNLKALFYDVIRNYRNYEKEELLKILEKFKNCSQFYDLDELELMENLYYENILCEFDCFDKEISEALNEIYSVVSYRRFSKELDF